MFRSPIILVAVLTFLIVVSAELDRSSYGGNLRAKRAINPFMDSIGKRAADSGMFRFDNMKRYLESLTNEVSGRRSPIVFVPVYVDE
ncbi:hypothetical protein FO519_001259 [Halicephalobus sp. NKZ332]|nr:hypothetical protein FO519_001259 [Halicephalobus sp. NKZ332]